MSHAALIIGLHHFGTYANTESNTNTEYSFKFTIALTTLHKSILSYYDPVFILENAIHDCVLCWVILRYFDKKKTLPPSAATTKYKMDDACPICLEDGCNYIIPTCQHVYHRECIEPWFVKMDGTCCICKTEILK